MPRAKKASINSSPAVLDLSPPETAEPPVVTDQDENFEDLGAKGRYRKLVWLVAFTVIVIALFAGFKVIYAQKVYPGVSVDGIYLGGLSQAQAKSTLETGLADYKKSQILVHYANTSLAIDLAKINTTFDAESASVLAYQHGRFGSLRDQLWEIARGLINRPTAIRQFNFDDAKLAPYFDQIGSQIDAPVSNAALSISDAGRVGVTPAQSGQRLDLGGLTLALEDRIGTGSTDAITAAVNELPPSVSTTDLNALVDTANNYLEGPLKLTLNGVGKTVDVPVKDMIPWIKVNQPPLAVASTALTLTSLGGYQIDQPKVSLGLDDASIGAYVAGLAKSVDQVGQNAALTIANNVATVFQPEKTGYSLDQPAAVIAIKNTLSKPADQRTVALNVKVTQPAVTAANLNDLGINELLSEGITYFPGSPAARMQNIRVGASKFNGVLVAPDSVFSFESLLGNVDAAAGYAPALVILGDKEVYQYGGGMCQVSSTAYRAALLAGLPIVERHSHSFAVGYYTAPFGVPGVDATVFDLSVDFKFKNDTGHYILIQTVLSGTTLKFDFYGTKTKTGVIHPPTFIDPPGGAGWNATIPSTTVFTRDILDLAGNVIKTDTITTHYKSSLDFPVVKELN